MVPSALLARSPRKYVSLALALLLALAVLPAVQLVSARAANAATGTLPSSPPNAFEAGDGNMTVDNGTGYLDWASAAVTSSPDFLNQPDSHSECGLTDDIFGQGTKESSTTPSVSCQPSTPKVDLQRLYGWIQSTGGHEYLYLAWEAPQQAGSNNNHIDFELNQAPQTAPPAGGGTWQLNRTVGDLLFDFDITPNNPTVQYSTWTGSDWSAEQPLSNAYAAVNANTFLDPVSGGLVLAGAFGEMGIDLNASGLFSSTKCANFADVWAKGRSSGSGGSAGQSEMKDFIPPQTFAVSNCSALKIKKVDDAGNLLAGATFSIAAANSSTPAVPADDATCTTDATGYCVTAGGGYPLVFPGSYVVTETQQPAGYLKADPASQTVAVTQGQDASVTFVDPKIAPKLRLQKSADVSTYDTLGAAVHYAYKLTNTGNVTLTGPYSVTDDKTNVVCSANLPALPPDASTSVTCTSTYHVTQADLDSGSVTNVATAYARYAGQPVASNQDSVTITATQHPALTLVKAAKEQNYAAAGDTLHYTYTLTNSGNVTLTAPYSVTDDKIATGDISCPDRPAAIAPGGQVTCTGSYTVTQADLDAGKVVNHATGHATFGGTTVDSNQDTVEVPALQDAQLGLTKTADQPTYDAVGQKLGYHYVLKNIGNVTLSAPYAVSDDKIADAHISCPQTPATLAPGDTVTCTGSYQYVTQTDLDAGSITNTATATAYRGGDVITSLPAKATVLADQQPKLVLAKDADQATYSNAGDVLTYTYTLTNGGNVTLSAPYAVGDNLIPDVSCPDGPATLAPGESVVCHGSYTVTQADVDADIVINEATATATWHGGTITSNEDDAQVPGSPTPGLTLVKSVTDPTSLHYSRVGQLISYAYDVTNTGNVTLHAPYAIDDDVIGNGVADCSSAPSTLKPGDAFTCTATYAITQADLDAGTVTNHATATASWQGNGDVGSNESDATVTADQTPALSLAKTYTDARSAPTYDHVGQVLDYAYTLTNSGNVTLHSPYKVRDDHIATADIDCSSGPADLAPGASFDCTGSYTVTQADLDAGSVTNLARATATYGGDQVRSNEATATVDATQNAALALDKNVTESGYDAAGQTLHYTYTLTNSGNVTLHSPYAVQDDKIDSAQIDCGNGPADLAPGASFDCTASYAVTQADVDAGTITNHATATASFKADGDTTSNPDSVTIGAAQAAALHLDKSVAQSSYAAAGDVLDYTYTLTNTGNVTLHAPYAVQDDHIATADIDCSAGPADLAPGASFDCTGSYTVTQADVDAGSVTNVATATATRGDHQVTSNEDSATVQAAQTPSLSLVKNAAEPSYAAVGDVLHYTYTLTNDGNVTLHAPYAVQDDKIATADVDCSSGPADLAPGASFQCTGAYTVTQADLDAGKVTNVASGTATYGGGTVTSNEDTVTVPAVVSPAIQLVKSADRSSVEYGDTLTYTLQATNTGNATLNDVVVTDVVPDHTSYVDGSAAPAAATPAYDAASRTVTWHVGSLAPGESSVALTFQVTIDQPDYDPTVGLPAETIDNVALVQATGVPSTPSNHVKTPVVAVLGEKVVKHHHHRTPKPQPAPQPHVLPFTGATVPTVLASLLGLVLIGIGVALTAVRRRGSHRA